MMGYTCDFQQAEALLRESLDREIPLSGPDSSNISKRLFELARLNFDQGKYAEAASYYAKAIPMAERLGIEKDDPVALANSLDELAQAYQLSGQAALAVASAQDAAVIRARNIGRAVVFVPVRYTAVCPA
jgi:tetratricopeptide (TPR) repeat protein